MSSFPTGSFGAGGYGDGPYGGDQGIPPLSYYINLFTSQYQNSPNLLAFAALLMQPFIDAANCAASMFQNFDVNSAIGVQLDALGTLIGVSRTLPFTPNDGLSPVLSDSDYRILLQAKILQNNWNGQGQGANNQLWAAWQQMFPGGRIYITDNQNMTCSIFLVGAFSDLQKQMITNGLIVPRPEGVMYTYEFATLPIFGWGNLNPTFVQGWGTGSGAYPGGSWA